MVQKIFVVTFAEPEITIRLVGSENDYEGRVEVRKKMSLKMVHARVLNARGTGEMCTE